MSRTYRATDERRERARPAVSHEFANGVKCYDDARIVWANDEDCLHDYSDAEPAQDAPERCARRDYVTDERCTRDAGHEPYHVAEDGQVFGIGYLPE